ncbi:MAG: iron ABC transporter permease [Bacteroidota bacterium]
MDLAPAPAPSPWLARLRRVSEAVWRNALWVPVGAVALGVLVPLGYLVARAFGADLGTLTDLVFRARTLRLATSTIGLTVAVLASTTALALPLAWLVARTDLPARRAFAVLGALPLAVPGYVMAFALLAATGPNGLIASVTGLVIPRPSGFLGAWLALTLTLFPYLFLGLRAALLGLDPAPDEAARMLGASPWRRARAVVLPQLRPALLAGGLLVGLHVLGDFGVVSLMRFETFSFAIYLQYAAAYDRVYAAALALMLLVLTGALLWGEARLLRGRRFARTGAGAARRQSVVALGGWRWPAAAAAGAVALLSVGVPIAASTFWLGQGLGGANEGGVWGDLASGLVDSVSAALPAAFMAAALAVPVGVLSVRRPSRRTALAERVAYLGYATPPLAFALAFVFVAIRAVPWAYQTLGLLIVAYALHFLAEALGPVRTSLYQTSARGEEAARMLGRGPLRAFAEVTLPVLRRGLGVSVALVFLSALKELPIAFLLSPLGFESLATRAWAAAGESLFAIAAPYALALVAVSTPLVALALRDA